MTTFNPANLCERAREEWDRMDRLYARALAHQQAGRLKDREACALLAARALVKALNAQIEHDVEAPAP